MNFVCDECERAAGGGIGAVDMIYNMKQLLFTVNNMQMHRAQIEPQLFIEIGIIERLS